MASKSGVLIIMLVFFFVIEIESRSSVESACELAEESESCRSSLLQNPRSSRASPKDLSKIALDASLAQVQRVYDIIPPIGWVSRAFDAKTSRAIDNCLTFIDLALDHLKMALANLNRSPEIILKFNHAVDIQTLLSASLTNHRTCLTELQQANVNISQFTFAAEIGTALRSVKISLAVINKLWISGKSPVRHNRRLLSHGEDFSSGFPSWLLGGDRRLLLDRQGVPVDVTVAKNGSGDYNTIGDAINGAPENSRKKYVIRVTRGIYKENLVVPKNKRNIVLVGDGIDATVITGDRSVAGGWTTLDTSTLLVLANGFMARDMTIQNTAGPHKLEAVAALLASDFAVLHRCKLMGFQDTVYAHSLRQFYSQCDIYGTIDFICGNAAAMFQKCNIVARKPLSGQKNVIAASERNSPNENTGIVIRDCTVAASTEMGSSDRFVLAFLGRPWGNFARIVYMQSYLGGFIQPQGWIAWPGPATPASVYYGEYENRGPGARISDRIKLPGFHVMDSSQAQQFSLSVLFHKHG